ncbi:AAA family ATPase [Paracraurococcus ruber]|uniref:AAA family ATPase n=1 Tax=Paracraurococcus ruber TaxID=77675 RepID=A0ABS1D4V8_9PROT|nr:AAA family ATPase [Paracraurococcus ruber]MBK1661883.1 AAA family ATPase [Paracraurococcus ruber]TDG22996.1 AAA family ATPase [Paracraurococcus ruber]
MSLRRAVAAAPPADANRGILRLDPADMAALGVAVGGLVAVTGTRTAHARALPLPPAERGQARVVLDGATRANAGIAVGGEVALAAAPAPVRARRLTLSVAGTAPAVPALRRALTGLPLSAGDAVRLPLLGGREAALRVAATDPEGPVLPDEATQIALEQAGRAAERDAIRYEDIGGLSRVLDRVREVVELPLRHPEAFAALGITPPKGVLLVGPPGTGKTLIARAVAAEANAHFILVNGPEIVDRYYGASEQQLRAVFEEARKRAPTIVFIDEIDAIAPKRDALSGEKQVERRIVAQLLTLMDGLAGRGEVVVLAATNLPDSLDPALRRPGRFDREIRIDPPDRQGRREILAVHSRAMPLAPDVDLDAIAEATPGMVGADLAALCREAAMAALARAGALSPGGLAVPVETLSVAAPDFAAARASVTPSALREVFVEIPDVRWSDIAGAEALRVELRRAVEWPLRNPAMFARLGLRPPRGVLLHGAPGTGKTLAAKALATEAGTGFIAIRGPELLTQWQGASERALRDIFARARQAAPCILFFDEVDAIAPRRGSGDGATLDRMVAQFLTEMDGVADPPGVVVLGATNRPDRMDPALLRPGRFDLVLEVPLPDAAARRAILRLHAAKLPLAPDVDLDALAGATGGMAGADLAGLCRAAALRALGRAEAVPDTITITAADMAAALAAAREMRPWTAA